MRRILPLLQVRMLPVMLWMVVSPLSSDPQQVLVVDKEEEDNDRLITTSPDVDVDFGVEVDAEDNDSVRPKEASSHTTSNDKEKNEEEEEVNNDPELGHNSISPRTPSGPVVDPQLAKSSKAHAQVQKIDTNSTNDEKKPASSVAETTTRRGRFIIFLAVVVLLGCSAGLIGGLVGKNRRHDDDSIAGFVKGDNTTTNNTDPPPFPTSNNRQELIMEYIISQGVSTLSDLELSGTPQRRALEFMDWIDDRQVVVPSSSSSSSSNGVGVNTVQGYNFITRYIMVVFYHAMNGPQWNYDLLFLSEHDTCDWFFVFGGPVGQVGVLCNQNTKQIVGLSLIQNQLEGELPKEMGHLTTLEYIELIGNNIQGTIPDTWSQLSNLRTLVLLDNLLTGTIPSWIGNGQTMTKLEFLYMSNNAFEGSLPTFTTNKEKLVALAVNDNYLGGPIDVVWTFINLECVDVGNNILTGSFPISITTTNPMLKILAISGNNDISGTLPSDLFRLSKLEILDVHGTAIDGSLPSDVGLNSPLELIALYDNSISGTIPTTLANLQGLRHLDLSNNQLTGDIPNELENYWNHLEYLYLSKNYFTPGIIPTYFYTFPKLLELGLKSTSRTGPIPPLVASLNNLILLDLDDNMLTGGIPTTLGDLSNLQFLLLNRNQLDGVIPTELGSNWPTIQVCMLDRNNLTGSMDNICQWHQQKLSLATADCNEVVCECCALCCVDDDTDSQQDCHNIDGIPNFIPGWDTGYQRDDVSLFNFGNRFSSGSTYEFVKNEIPPL